MSDRMEHQLELALDTFWNGRVSGVGALQPDSPETMMVARLSDLEEVPEPRSGFLDALWSQLLEDEQPIAATVPEVPDVPKTVAPVLLTMPARPVQQPTHGNRRWARVAASIAALLAIVMVGAIFFADRRDDGGIAPAAEGWSMTGGNPGKTNANPRSSPIPNQAIRWRAQTDGRIEGVPVVADGVVFAGNQEHHMYAIDAATGLQLWVANLGMPIASSAAVGDGVVVIATTTTLYGLDVKTGDIRWQREDLVAQQSPTIVGETIFVVDSDNRIRSIALDTGADRWSSDAFAEPPAFAIDEQHGRLIVTTSGGVARALSTQDGTQLWQAEPGIGALGTPLIDGDLVALPVEGGVVRIDGANGQVGLQNLFGFEGIPALALAGDQLVASTDIMVVSYDRDTLAVQWSNQLLTGLTGGLTLGSSSIYLPGSDRTLTALDRKTGEVQWTLPLDEVAQEAPAATSDGLFLSTRSGSIYAIGGGEISILNAPPVGTVQDPNSPARVLWKSSGGPNALKNPLGIAIAPSGEIWVCDTANDRLQVFDSDGNFLREFGSHGNAPGQFDFGEETAELDGFAPLGHQCSLAFDTAGALYVADAANFRVQRFPAEAIGRMIHANGSIEENGTVMPFPTSSALPDLIIGKEGTGDGEFLFASDVAVTGSGDIYIGDRLRLDVQRFDSDGNFRETIGQPAGADSFGPGSFSRMVGIAVDQDGRLLVADDDQQRIVRRDPDGTWTVAQLPRRDNRINGITVDALGNLFVSQIDYVAASFWIYDSTGAPLAQVGSFGSELGQFDGPAGIALDGLGNVYVADWAMGRFQKFEIDYTRLEALASDAGG